MQTDRQNFTFSQSNVSGFLFSLLTDLNWKDPKTFIAREMPGLAQDRSVVLRKSAATGEDGPEDYGPKGDVIPKNGEGGEGSITANPTAPPDANDAVHVPQVPAAQPPKMAGRNVAFIYQSHNQESYLPELDGVKDPDKAYDPKKNVTLVGLRLAQMLEKEGIGAVHSDKNYPAIEKSFNYYYSYKYSLKTLQEASASHPDLQFYFDIHRDSQRRGKTTVELNGKDYAQVYFVIGGKNAKWKENEQFASEIHHALEKKYPGISKGTFAKAAEGNGVYNQNFSPNSVLIEVGGVDNSLEECYRTVGLLAEAIAEVVLNVQKVDGTPADKDKIERKPN
jgi:stage II sporulation protein P